LRIIAFDGLTLGLILALVTGDLSIRYLAFRRLDSISLSLAFYSLTGSATALLYDQTRADEVEQSSFGWWIRIGGGILVLILLLCFHATYLHQLDRQITSNLEEQEVDSESSDLRRDALRKLAPVLVRATLLTFVGFRKNNVLRAGKAEARRDSVALLTSLTGRDFSESKLMLPRTTQILMALAFLALGCLSLGLAVLSFSSL
jgi:hypothetical protein